MAYTALYRKWRPARFEDVRGQEHIVRTLKNQIISEISCELPFNTLISIEIPCYVQAWTLCFLYSKKPFS